MARPDLPIDIGRLAGPLIDRSPVEIVERKGLGHPDSICDALAEAFSASLCRFHRERFGLILHHNVDKVLLRGRSGERDWMPYDHNADLPQSVRVRGRAGGLEELTEAGNECTIVLSAASGVLGQERWWRRLVGAGCTFLLVRRTTRSTSSQAAWR